MKLFTIQTDDEIIGIEAKYVYRVLDEVKITPVCLMPPCYLGVLYYRGELFDAIDIGILMEKGKSAFKEADRIVLLRWSDKKLALAPGTIHGLIWIDGDLETDGFRTQEGRSVRLITPEQIWEKILEMQCGPFKV